MPMVHFSRDGNQKIPGQCRMTLLCCFATGADVACVPRFELFPSCHKCERSCCFNCFTISCTGSSACHACISHSRHIPCTGPSGCRACISHSQAHVSLYQSQVCKVQYHGELGCLCCRTGGTQGRIGRIPNSAPSVIHPRFSDVQWPQYADFAPSHASAQALWVPMITPVQILACAYSKNLRLL